MDVCQFSHLLGWIIFVCLSNVSVKGRGFVQKKLKNALDIWDEKLEDNLYLIPVRLEECELPDSLEEFVSVDLFQEAEFARLLQSIHAGSNHLQNGELELEQSKQISTNQLKPSDIPISDLAKSLLEEIQQDTRSNLQGLVIYSSSHGGFYIPYVRWNINEKIDDSLYPYRPLTEILKIKLAIQELVEKNILIHCSGDPDSNAWYLLRESAERFADTLSPSLLEEIRNDTRRESSEN